MAGHSEAQNCWEGYRLRLQRAALLAQGQREATAWATAGPRTKLPGVGLATSTGQGQRAEQPPYLQNLLGNAGIQLSSQNTTMCVHHIHIFHIYFPSIDARVAHFLMPWNCSKGSSGLGGSSCGMYTQRWGERSLGICTCFWLDVAGLAQVD